MLELTLNAEMAVKLIDLKRRAQVELGKKFSIISEEEVAHLIISAAKFSHRHSKARVLAMELVDGIESLDFQKRHTDFIAECRGLTIEETVEDERVYRGQKVIDDNDIERPTNAVKHNAFYRGHEVLNDQLGAQQNEKEKVIYYRGQRVVS